jgi:hypothetical protein
MQKLTQAAGQFSIIERLRKLARASGKPTEMRVEDGRKLQGFRAEDAGKEGSYLIWADAKTGDIVRAEYHATSPGGIKATMSAFDFTTPVDEKLFSIAPPADYKPMLASTVKVYPPSEESLVLYLRTCAEASKDHVFPSSLHAALLEVSKYVATHTAKGTAGQVSPEAMDKTVNLSSGLTFVGTMQPENDYHYVGSGVTLGSADKAIAWYKPHGATLYRVIYGDLSVRDVPPEQLPASK